MVPPATDAAWSAANAAGSARAPASFNRCCSHPSMLLPFPSLPSPARAPAGGQGPALGQVPRHELQEAAPVACLRGCPSQRPCRQRRCCSRRRRRAACRRIAAALAQHQDAVRAVQSGRRPAAGPADPADPGRDGRLLEGGGPGPAHEPLPLRLHGRRAGHDRGAYAALVQPLPPFHSRGRRPRVGCYRSMHRASLLPLLWLLVLFIVPPSLPLPSAFPIPHLLLPCR